MSSRSELRWATVRWYVTSQTGQLSFPSSAGRETSTGQETVAMLYSWEGNRPRITEEEKDFHID